MQNNWSIPALDDTLVSRLASGLDITPTTARILLQRGIGTPEDARLYLTPSLSDIPRPAGLPEMDKALDRISRAIARNEKIAIFGDYDVDGVTGTAMLKLFLREVGCDVITLLPNRCAEGYGLTTDAVDTLSKLGANLIITVDNGTNSGEAVNHAAWSKIDVVVTDHHEPSGERPYASAVVNPKFLDSSSPFYHLSGCGVAFMLVLGLRSHLREMGRLPTPEPNLKQHMDLVALGTVADVVPLTGVNRTFAKFGLMELAKSGKAGIRALLGVSATDPANISPTAVSFRLGPRLNAAGRIGDANLALRLLLAYDMSEARGIALSLDKANRERQKIEEAILSEVEVLLANNTTSPAGGLVMHSKNWHVGVLGIVASKIAERTGRPTVIISQDTDPARGSARSAGGLNLIEALDGCADLLVRYGGHTLAAGLSIKADRIMEFSRRFNHACQGLSDSNLGNEVKIDALIEPDELSDRFIAELSMCEPFGMGNPEPVLAIEDMKIDDAKVLVDKHLKLRVSKNGYSFEAIGFSMKDKFSHNAARASIAFVPQHNVWNGITSIQMKIRDICYGHL